MLAKLAQAARVLLFSLLRWDALLPSGCPRPARDTDLVVARTDPANTEQIYEMEEVEKVKPMFRVSINESAAPGERSATE